MDPGQREELPLGPAASRRELLGLLSGIALAGCAGSGAASPPAELPADRSARLDEELAQLTDQRGSVAPIQAEERAARRARLGGLLSAAGIDALMCEGGATMRYLSGVGWGRSERAFALVVLADGSHFWLCPAFEAEKARLRIDRELDPDFPGGPIVAWQEDEYAWQPLAAALREHGAQRVAHDPQARWFLARGLERELGAGQVLEAQALLIELRARKEPHELALLRRANELTQQAIVAASELVRPGMAGDEIAALMQHAQRRLGLEQTWCLALVGPAAAYPHGEDHGRQLARGELLLIDTGGSFHDYQSDDSRTWAVGGPPGVEERRAWNAVRDAQQRAFEPIRPGVLAREVDGAARAAIERAGYPGGFEVFTHRLGHGIGLEGHEDPYFDGGSEVVLESGMTLSDEPGIYLYGRFGVRLEDIVQVTESGADHFGSWQRGPESPA